MSLLLSSLMALGTLLLLAWPGLKRSAGDAGCARRHDSAR